MHYLIDTGYNWADEIDIDGHMLVSEEELQDLRERVAKLMKSDKDLCYNMYVGSNEDQDFYPSDLDSALENVEKVSDADAEVLKRVGVDIVGGFDFYEVLDNLEEQNGGEPGEKPRANA